MADEISIFFSVAGLITAVIGLSFQHFKVIGDLKDSISRVKEEQGNFDKTVIERLSKLETKIEIFWSVVERSVAKTLKAPVHVEMDNLLDKFINKTITKDEMVYLKNILEKEINEMTHTKKDSARLLAIALMLGRIESELGVG